MRDRVSQLFSLKPLDIAVLAGGGAYVGLRTVNFLDRAFQYRVVQAPDPVEVWKFVLSLVLVAVGWLVWIRIRIPVYFPPDLPASTRSYRLVTLNLAILASAVFGAFFVAKSYLTNL